MKYVTRTTRVNIVRFQEVIIAKGTQVRVTAKAKYRNGEYHVTTDTGIEIPDINLI